MTCIVGLEDAGTVWLGGDSCVSWDADGAAHACTHDKVIKVGAMLVGFAGDLAAATVAAYCIAEPPEGLARPRAYLALAFAPAIRGGLKDAGVDGELDMLVGLAGRLWFVGSDGAVHGFEQGFGAIGSGSSYAQGALYAMHGIEPLSRVKVALEAAAASCNGVGPPYKILRGGQSA